MSDKEYGMDILDWEDSRPEEFSFLKHMIAGSWAGVMEHWGMFPFDTIKTHIQASTNKMGIFSTTAKLYKENGILRFYKGVNVIASGWIPAHACYFSTYEIAKEKFGIDDGNTHFVVSGIIGALATVTHDAFLTPSDWLKQRMQLTGQSTWDCLKKTLRQEGARALFRSYPVTLLMNVPFAFTIVSANENLKVYARPKDHKYPISIYFGWAFAAGMVASFLTNPMDVIKTRLQTQHHNSSLGGLDKEAIKLEAEKLGGRLEVEGSEVLRDAKYRDIRHAIRQIYKSEGILGFYKGVLPRVLFVSPGVAISWGTYEIFKSLLIKDSS